MGWHTRFTRFGDMHMVFSQDAENSCGIACVRMCAYKVNKSSPTKQAMFSEGFLYKAYAGASDADYDGSSYTSMGFLCDTLNILNCGDWEIANVGTGPLVQSIIDSVGEDIVGLGLINTVMRGDPVIVCTSWTGGGSHFVVIDTINNFMGKLYASVCDPADGDVHIVRIEPGKPFPYQPKNQAFTNSAEKTDKAPATGFVGSVKNAATLLAEGKTSWSIGGPKYAYSSRAASSGNVLGWIVRKIK